MHADNGVDGLWQATENFFDVIVLDIMLPGLNGYEVLRRLRAAQVWTPVLMLTAKMVTTTRLMRSTSALMIICPNRWPSLCYLPGCAPSSAAERLSVRSC